MRLDLSKASKSERTTAMTSPTVTYPHCNRHSSIQRFDYLVISVHSQSLTNKKWLHDVYWINRRRNFNFNYILKTTTRKSKQAKIQFPHIDANDRI